MSNFTERLRDYGLTLEEDVIICDRRVVDQAADMIDELARILRFLACVDFNRFTEHDELLLESVLNDAKRAVESLNDD